MSRQPPSNPPPDCHQNRCTPCPPWTEVSMLRAPLSRKANAYPLPPARINVKSRPQALPLAYRGDLEASGEDISFPVRVSLIRQAVEILFSTQKDGVSGERRRSAELIFQPVLRESLEWIAVLEHSRHALAGRNVNPPAGSYRRGEDIVQSRDAKCAWLIVARARVHSCENA